MKSNVLTMKREEVLFDVNNEEHIKAFKMLCLVEPAKQHHALRFKLEFPFVDIRAMMMTKVATAYCVAPKRTRKAA